jgi:hypothetical protein
MEIIAVGQHAEGIFAFGQFATGVIAVGQVATGVIAIGQVARGVICIGQVAVGFGWGLGMLAVAPGKAIGMLSLGGRAKGLLPLSILPKPRQYLPGVDVIPAADLLLRGVANGWIAVRLDRDGMGRLVGYEKNVQVPLEITDPDARDRANELLQTGKRDVLVRVEAGRRPHDDATGYRSAPSTERILQGLQVEPKPSLPAISGGAIANWIVRGAIVAGLAVGWWAVAGQPLAEALGLLD